MKLGCCRKDIKPIQIGLFSCSLLAYIHHVNYLTFHLFAANIIRQFHPNVVTEFDDKVFPAYFNNVVICPHIIIISMKQDAVESILSRHQ